MTAAIEIPKELAERCDRISEAFGIPKEKMVTSILDSNIGKLEKALDDTNQRLVMQRFEGMTFGEVAELLARK